MEAHCHPDGHQLTLRDPNFFAISFTEGQIMASAKKELYKLDRIGPGFGLTSSESGSRDLYEPIGDLFVSFDKAIEELMTGR